MIRKNYRERKNFGIYNIGLEDQLDFIVCIKFSNNDASSVSVEWERVLNLDLGVGNLC